MTITFSLDWLTTPLRDNPWPTVVLVLVLGMVLPAVWSTRHHAQAIAVLRTLLDAAATIVLALRGTRPR
jgi:hypothetical protein